MRSVVGLDRLLLRLLLENELLTSRSGDTPKVEGRKWSGKQVAADGNDGTANSTTCNVVLENIALEWHSGMGVRLTGYRVSYLCIAHGRSCERAGPSGRAPMAWWMP